MGGTFTMPLKEVMVFEKDTGTGLNIGLSDYPIFDENHRVILNRKIIDHYWNREIGLESISLFVFALRRKMNEIMPLYNQVYESQLLEFEAISNYKLTTTRKDTTTESGESDSTSDATTTAKSGARAVGSTFPQTQLSRNKDYATTGNDSTTTGSTESDSSGKTTTSGNSEVDGTTTTVGYQGSPSDLLLKFRATILNTDMLVIDELEECFMQVWDNGEEMLPSLGIGYYR